MCGRSVPCSGRMPCAASPPSSSASCSSPSGSSGRWPDCRRRRVRGVDGHHRPPGSPQRRDRCRARRARVARPSPRRGASSVPSSSSSASSSRRCPTRGGTPRAAGRSGVGIGVAARPRRRGPRAGRPASTGSRSASPSPASRSRSACPCGATTTTCSTPATCPPGRGSAPWSRSLAYLAVASGYAVLGGMRDTGRLTWLATAALVVFITVQAFAVFAPIALRRRAVPRRRCRAAAAPASWPTAAVDGSCARRRRPCHDDRRRCRTRPAGARCPDARLTTARAARVGAVVVASLALVVVAVWAPLAARLTGEEVTLRVEPVDPIDPFRGAYVDLSYPDLPDLGHRRGRADRGRARGARREPRHGIRAR